MKPDSCSGKESLNPPPNTLRGLWGSAVHTRIELVPHDRQSCILTIRPMHQLRESLLYIRIVHTQYNIYSLIHLFLGSAALFLKIKRRS